MMTKFDIFLLTCIYPVIFSFRDSKTLLIAYV